MTQFRGWSGYFDEENASQLLEQINLVFKQKDERKQYTPVSYLWWSHNPDFEETSKTVSHDDLFQNAYMWHESNIHAGLADIWICTTKHRIELLPFEDFWSKGVGPQKVWVSLDNTTLKTWSYGYVFDTTYEKPKPIQYRWGWEIRLKE